LAVAVALPLMFTSCERKTDDVATITIAQPGNAVTEDANGNFTISGTISSPEGTRIDDISARLVHGGLTHLVADNSRDDNTFTGSGNRFLFSINQSHAKLAELLEKIQDENPEATSVVLRFTASVRNGGMPTELNVTINFPDEPTTPLSEPTAFTWERVGGTAATGMSQFGLQMVTAGAVGNFRIQVSPAAVATTKLVNLAAADWTGITTKEALKERIDAAASVANVEFPMVNNSSVNSYVGVRHNDDYFIFHVVSTATASAGDAGTRNTVSGNFKN